MHRSHLRLLVPRSVSIPDLDRACSRTHRLCIAHVLRNRGLSLETEVPVSVEFDGLVIETGFRLDLLVENCVVVELKTVTKLAPVHNAQLLSYLRLTNQKTGLLINFHVTRLKEGIKRIAN